MDYKTIFILVWGGLFFTLLRKQLADILMETLVKTLRKKKYTDEYRRFIEYWFLFCGIICFIFAIQEIFKK